MTTQTTIAADFADIMNVATEQQAFILSNYFFPYPIISEFFWNIYIAKSKLPRCGNSLGIRWNIFNSLIGLNLLNPLHEAALMIIDEIGPDKFR
tara:strand:+ start:365 stop:646 length:282 start_codon:yes stop_codon:yes gene_type:complete